MGLVTSNGKCFEVKDCVITLVIVVLNLTSQRNALSTILMKLNTAGEGAPFLGIEKVLFSF